VTPVHFSETCDEDAPQLITHVETTRAGINDEQALSAIHAGLEGSDLLPDQHLVDAGYVDTEYDVTHFSIDWQAHTVTCPHGQISSSWTPAAAMAKATPFSKSSSRHP
jgi:hypothetical protein